MAHKISGLPRLVTELAKTVRTTFRKEFTDTDIGRIIDILGKPEHPCHVNKIGDQNVIISQFAINDIVTKLRSIQSITNGILVNDLKSALRTYLESRKRITNPSQIEKIDLFIDYIDQQRGDLGDIVKDKPNSPQKKIQSLSRIPKFSEHGSVPKSKMEGSHPLILGSSKSEQQIVPLELTSDSDSDDQQSLNSERVNLEKEYQSRIQDANVKIVFSPNNEYLQVDVTDENGGIKQIKLSPNNNKSLQSLQIDITDENGDVKHHTVRCDNVNANQFSNNEITVSRIQDWLCISILEDKVKFVCRFDNNIKYKIDDKGRHKIGDDGEYETYNDKKCYITLYNTDYAVGNIVVEASQVFTKDVEANKLVIKSHDDFYCNYGRLIVPDLCVFSHNINNRGSINDIKAGISKIYNEFKLTEDKRGEILADGGFWNMGTVHADKIVSKYINELSFQGINHIDEIDSDGRVNLYGRNITEIRNLCQINNLKAEEVIVHYHTGIKQNDNNHDVTWDRHSYVHKVADGTPLKFTEPCF